MTLRRYAHVLEDMEDEGGRAMDDLFLGTSFSIQIAHIGGTPQLRFRILLERRRRGEVGAQASGSYTRA